jgi:hypothetical protein
MTNASLQGLPVPSVRVAGWHGPGNGWIIVFMSWTTISAAALPLTGITRGPVQDRASQAMAGPGQAPSCGKQ